MFKRRLFVFLIFALASASLLVYSGPCLEGAKLGLQLSYSVVVPSLFPFTVCAIMISECGVFEKINNFLIKRNCNLPINESFTLLFSLIGGFPIGAKLINNNYIKGNISKKHAETMLSYCVNSGPAFIIVAIGSGVLLNKTLGLILLASNTLSALSLYMFSNIHYKREPTNKYSKNICKSFSDIFVNSTYDATKSMCLISAFVVLFSAIINILTSILTPSNFNKLIISSLEITNGVTLINNIYIIAFLLGFSGFCVHFQVLSMCSNLKPNYIKFITHRFIHGIMNILYTLIIVKIFKVTVPTISNTQSFSYTFSEHSILFGFIFIGLSLIFIGSVNSKNNI